MAESSMEDIPNFLSMDTDLSLEYFAASNYANGIASADEPWKELSDGSDSGIDTFSLKPEPQSPSSLFSDSSSDLGFSASVGDGTTQEITEITAEEWDSIHSLLAEDISIKTELSSPRSSVSPVEVPELDSAAVFPRVIVQPALATVGIPMATSLLAGSNRAIPVANGNDGTVGVVLNSKVKIRPKPISILATSSSLPTSQAASSAAVPVHSSTKLPRMLPAPTTVTVPAAAAPTSLVDLRAVKRQQRMIKNRESACLSRKRKKDYMQSLEQQLQAFNVDNERLRAENVSLKRKLALLLSENERLKKSSYAVSSKTAAGASMLFCVLLLVSFNFFPLRPAGNMSSDQMVVSQTQRIGRRNLLSVDASVSSSSSMLYETSARNMSSSALVEHKQLTTGSDASDVSIWQDMHDLVFGRRRGEVTGANRFICPTFFNSTESLRLVAELRGWVLGHEEELRRQRELMILMQQQASSRPSHRKKYYATPRKLKAAMRAGGQSKHLHPGKYELQVFRGASGQYDNFLEAINRRNDTFYVVSFRHDHLLLPATAHNKTMRPRMSVMMPAVGLNETMQPPVGSIAMMQIDCEVTATKLVHIRKSAVPDHMLGNFTSTTSHHQQRQRTNFAGRRMSVMSDVEN